MTVPVSSLIRKSVGIPNLRICHTYPTMMKLAQLYLIPKGDAKNRAPDAILVFC